MCLSALTCFRLGETAEGGKEANLIRSGVGKGLSADRHTNRGLRRASSWRSGCSATGRAQREVQSNTALHHNAARLVAVKPWLRVVVFGQGRGLRWQHWSSQLRRQNLGPDWLHRRHLGLAECLHLLHQGELPLELLNSLLRLLRLLRLFGSTACCEINGLEGWPISLELPWNPPQLDL